MSKAESYLPGANTTSTNSENIEPLRKFEIEP